MLYRNVVVAMALACLPAACTSGGGGASTDAGPDATLPDGRTPYDVDAARDARRDVKDAGPGARDGGDASAAADAGVDADGAAEASPPDVSAQDASTADALPPDSSAHDGPPADALPEDASDATVHDSAVGDGSPTDARAGDGDVRAADASSTSIVVSPLALTPAFSPSIHDYYVRCAAGSNELSVAMTAAQGSTVALARPYATAPSSAQTQPVSVVANDAIVVDVASDAGKEEYWVRCLPADFPRIAVAHHFDAGVPPPGYYAIGNRYVMSGNAGYAIILDVNGVPVWYHDALSKIGVMDVESLEPGVLSFAGVAADQEGLDAGPFEIHDIAAGTTTLVVSSVEPIDHHELRRLPGGHYVFFTTPLLEGVDLSALSGLGTSENILGCNIQELDETGALVWEWVGTDHLDPGADTVWWESVMVQDASVVDTFHCNSIDVNDDGDLLVSIRQMDSVLLVSRQTGAVLWKMGGSAASKDGARYTTVSGDTQGPFHGQHDARLVPGGVSLFDDQITGSKPARAVIYDVDVDAGVATPSWQYVAKSPSSGMGSFRLTADGSRVIGWGAGGTFVTLTEVDEAGNDLLEFSFPAGSQSYRALKVPTSQFDLGVLRESVGAD
jgi:hypothetical protein